MGGYELTRNPFDEDQHQDPVVLAVDITDRSKGTFSVTLQDIPDGKLKTLRFALAYAYNTQGAVMGIQEEVAKAWELGPNEASSHIAKALSLGKASIASADSMAEAIALVTNAQRDLVMWGICDHKAEDFLFPKSAGAEPSATPFESSPLPWADEPLVGCNKRMLQLYTKIGLLDRLATAVLNYQDCRLVQAEAEWARIEKAREEAKKKKALEAKQPPSLTTPSTPMNSPALNESPSQ